MRIRLVTPLAAALLAAGCGPQAKLAPMLTMPGTQTHSGRYFPIAPGDTHGPLPGQTAPDCNGCHYDKAAAAPSATFKIFTCTHCHVLLRSGVYHDDPQASFQTWHEAAGVNQFAATVASANVIGVAPLDAACRSCHASGIAVDHAKVFTLPHQDAAGTIVAKCADCHLNPADRTQLGCASCHPHDLPATATGHLLVPDFQPADSTLCARCHEDGKIPVAVSAHAAGAGGFVVGTGAHAGAAGGACLACHDQKKATPPKTFVADFSLTNCTGCHVTVGGTALHDDPVTLGTLHAVVPTFGNTVAALGLSAACLSCHADGAAGAPANHEQLFPRAAGTQHAGIGCSACHGTGVRTDLTQMRCYGCHQTDATFATAHAEPLTHTSTGQNRFTLLDMTSAATCLRCHAPTTINPSNPILPITVAAHAHGEDSINTGKHVNVGCVDCHGTTWSVGGVYTAQDFTKRGCLTCHTSNNP